MLQVDGIDPVSPGLVAMCVIDEAIATSFGNSFNEKYIRARIYPCDHTHRATLPVYQKFRKLG